jgi:tyrosinase
LPPFQLIPKGTTDGFPCELFIMVSDYDEDRVDQEVSGTCNDAASYCGIRDKLYPDKKAMGFPFDRIPRKGVDELSSFVTPNMMFRECLIVFEDRTVVRTEN